MADDLDRSYQWAINTCNAPNVGYSQAYRNQQTVNGITYYDCSSFVWYALMNGDFQGIGTWESWPFVTYDIDGILTAAGWNRLTAYDNKWLSGDVVLGKWDTITLPNGQQITGFQHVEMCYEGTEQPGEGYLMGAHGASHYTLPNQVSIKTTLDYGVNGHDPNKYTYLYRWGEGGATGYGISIYQAAAILGNFWFESKVNPGCYNDTSSYGDAGYGMGMWTDYPYPQNNVLWIGEEMRAWVSDRYGEWYSGPGQTACVFADELNINGSYNNRLPGSMWTDTDIPQYTYTNALWPDFQTFLDAKNNTDLEDLTRQWFLHWESPTDLYYFDLTWPQRRQNAFNIYDYLLEHANDTSITDWIVRQGYVFLTDAEAYNNCVMFFRQASAGGGGGGLPDRKVGMPIWMMIKYRR